MILDIIMAVAEEMFPDLTKRIKSLAMRPIKWLLMKIIYGMIILVVLLSVMIIIMRAV